MHTNDFSKQSIGIFFFIYLAILALFWFWGGMPLIEMNVEFFVPHCCHNVKQQKMHQSQQYYSSIKGVSVVIFVSFRRIKSVNFCENFFGKFVAP